LAKLKKNRRLLGLIDFADWVVPIPTVARSACQCYNVHVSIDYQRGPKSEASSTRMRTLPVKKSAKCVNSL